MLVGAAGKHRERRRLGFQQLTPPRERAIEHAQYVYAGGAHGGAAFALRVVTNGGAASSSPTMKYYHFDHLGSVTAMSDESGHVVGPEWGGPGATAMGYDTWGARRNPDGTAANPASFNQQVGRREFTGHETIPSVGLVNMNGRVYDPLLGRFLSPDPNVQFVDSAQSYNRYSYVLNNPLRYADPTGYFLNHHFGFTDFATGDFQQVRHQFRDHPEQLGLTAFAAGACITGAGCVGSGLMVAAINAELAIGQGASTEQVLVTTAIGIAAGAIGGGVASAFGGNLAAQMVGGAVAGSISAAVTTSIYGGDLGTNVLQGAFNGATGAAMSFGLSKLGRVSQASAAEAQGERVASAPRDGGRTVYCGERGEPRCGVWKGDERSSRQLRRDVALAKGFLGSEKSGPNIRYRNKYEGVEYSFSLYDDAQRTDIHTDNDPHRVSFPPVPTGTKLVLEAHSHPGDSPFYEHFSGKDIDGVRVQQGLLTPKTVILLYDPHANTITPIPWQIFTATPYFWKF